MAAISRRTFLDRSKKTGLALAAGVTILGDPASVRAAPANDKVVLALIGCGGRGRALATGFAERGDCQFAYVCDCDANRLAPTAKRWPSFRRGRRRRAKPTSARCSTTSRSTR